MKIGDFVSVLDDDISGIVTSVKNGDVTIVTNDDFEMQFSKDELVVQGNALSKKEAIPNDITKIILDKEAQKKKKIPRIKPKERTVAPMVVDLHIHKLVPSEKGMSNYDMLTIQVDTAKRQLDFAVSKKIPKVVFIHGVGQGVLRAELEYLFRRYGGLKYYDADFQKYGRGATEVYIFQNKKNIEN